MEGVSPLVPASAVAAAPVGPNPVEPSSETTAQTAATASTQNSAVNQPAAIVDIQGNQQAAAPAAAQQAAVESKNGASTQNQNSDDSSSGELTDEEQLELEELKARDREVRTHEQAHLAALGPYKSGGPSYEYQTGPDGKQYAVGGEVPVDASPEPEPEKTVTKMQTIQRAALAPAEPSSTDRAVAAKAAQLESQARAEIAQENSGESEDPVQGTTAQEESTEAEPARRGPNPAELFASDPVCPVCGQAATPDHSHTSAVA
ncbi:MAG: hypothetical protein KDD66_02185 [Bdellovibrionales bacterium]|nr:hypothetical protein [Bdellovibrionales bacterium]